MSTACSNTWYLARIGNLVPSLVLSAATDAMVSIGSALRPLLLTPSSVRGMLSPVERADCGWRDDEDYRQVCDLVAAAAPMEATEARLGSSPSWQDVIDDFAKIAGYGLQKAQGEYDCGEPVVVGLADGDDDDGDDENKNTRNKATTTLPFLFPQIKIHASPNDDMVSAPAIRWLAQRCYADCEIVWHKELSSHLTMTLLGGPPRNPRMLYDICRHEFGVFF